MPRMTTGKTMQPPKRATPTIDVVRHADGLREAAEQVRDLVERLTQGMTVLREMPQDAPERAEGEHLWSDLVVRVYVSLRDCYARFALLRIAMGNEAALALWDECLPTADALQSVGIPNMIAYWKGRTTRPEWMTHEEAHFVTFSMWPPKDTDPINRGLLDLIEPPPFD